jgi:alpha-1,2-mannosyltransferase
VSPRSDRRTPRTDALEFALVTLLTVMFSPLSFNYAYVWLMYPTTLALHLVISEPATARGHRLKVGWIVAVLLIPALAIPMPQAAQAYGNLFVPALLLVIGLGLLLRAAGRTVASDSSGVENRPGLGATARRGQYSLVPALVLRTHQRFVGSVKE